MRFSAMGNSRRPKETRRQWVTGVALMVATVISVVGFARISPALTMVIATASLVAILVFLWVVGKRKGDRTGTRER